MHHFVSHGSCIGHVVQGLSSVAVYSMQEDRYGVVQSDLGRIIGALLRLRTELEKVSSAAFGADMLNGGRSAETQRHCASLRGTLKRSLCQLAAVFGEYLPELLADAHDIRTMERFAQFRET